MTAMLAGGKRGFVVQDVWPGRRIMAGVCGQPRAWNDGVTNAMPYVALLYDVVDQFTERRAPFRAAHLSLVRDAHARGEIFMAGPLGEPALGALLVFQSESAEVAERFARADPYVLEGLVTRWRALPWTVVVEPSAGGRQKEP
jgi:uncharacterized protein